MARGNYIYPPEPTMRLTTDIFEYCHENVPKWNTISISGYHIREKGCSAVQEVAFTLSNAIAYVEAALDRGPRRSTSSRRGSPSSSTATTTSSRRSPSSAPCAGCGRRSSASASAPRTRTLADDPLPHPDRRRDAAGPAARGQHHPRRPAGLRRGLRRHPVAAHQRLRRGAGAADRALGADRAAHPAGARPRVRRRRHRRPVRRLLLRRVADRRDRDARLGADGEGRASSAARSRRSTSCSARSRSRRSPTTSATRAARTSSSASTSTSPTRSTTSTSSRSTRSPSARQLERLAKFKADRDQAAVEAKLEALRDVARGDGNLLHADPRGARRRRLDRRGLRRDARRLRRVQGRGLLLGSTRRSRSSLGRGTRSWLQVRIGGRSRARRQNHALMESKAKRTLVKSAPELWELADDLARMRGRG